MTRLDDTFIRSAQTNPLSVEFGGREFTFQATPARGAELEVREGDSIIGYITPWGSSERGVSRVPSYGAAPVIVGTLNAALVELVR